MAFLAGSRKESHMQTLLELNLHRLPIPKPPTREEQALMEAQGAGQRRDRARQALREFEAEFADLLIPPDAPVRLWRHRDRPPTVDEVAAIHRQHQVLR